MLVLLENPPNYLLTRLIKGDVGGQRTLRPYWRNYFEQTDAIVWVVDSGDRLRMEDCKQELHSLLQEDVRGTGFHAVHRLPF
jgi:GTPase SAR1 family protein